MNAVTARARVSVTLAAVLAVAAALRLAGLRFGLPAVYNPDEVAIMTRALAFATGDLNPHNFLYPTAYFYALFAWVGASFLLGWATGAVESLAAFQASFFSDPTFIYASGRLLGVFSGVLTVLLVFVAARRLFGLAAGLASAFFLAVSPIHVLDSHYVKHDVPVTLAITLATIAILRIWPLENRRGRLRAAALAGAACGVAFSTHYYAVFLAAPLVLAVWLAHGRDGLRALVLPLAVALAAMALAFFACSPFILVEPGTAWRDIVANRQIVVDRAVTSAGVPFATARRYLELLWLDAVGWPVLLLALAGFGLLARRAPRRALLLGAFPVVFLLFIVNTVAASRYLNPVIPFVALFAGYAVSEIAVRARPGSVASVAVLVTLAAGAPTLGQSVRAGLFFRQADTRTLATRFIESRVPPGAGVAIQPYSVVLFPTRDSLVDALERNLGGLEDVSPKFRLQLSLDPWPEPAYRLTYIGDGGLDADKIYVSYGSLGGAAGLEALAVRGVEYVVYKRVSSPAPNTLPLLEALERHGRLLAVFSPYAGSAGGGAEYGPAGVPASEVAEPFLHNTDARIQPPLVRPGPVVEVWRLAGGRAGASPGGGAHARPPGAR